MIIWTKISKEFYDFTCYFCGDIIHGQQWNFEFVLRFLGLLNLLSFFFVMILCLQIELAFSHF